MWFGTVELVMGTHISMTWLGMAKSVIEKVKIKVSGVVTVGQTG